MRLIKEVKTVESTDACEFEKGLEDMIERMQSKGLEIEVQFKHTFIEREGVRKLVNKYVALVIGHSGC